jgi:hypothetical protein
MPIKSREDFSRNRRGKKMAVMRMKNGAPTLMRNAEFKKSKESC